MFLLLITALNAAATICLIISQFTDLYYEFDEGNFYNRNDGYVLLILFSAAGLICAAAYIISEWGNLPRYTRRACLTYIILPAAATIAQYFIEDNGRGFDVNAAPGDDRRHIGIENVRTRLNILCGGTLDITSGIGVGTKAVIFVPEKKN